MDLGDIILALCLLWVAFKAGQISVALPIARALRDADLLDEDDEEDYSDQLAVKIERHTDSYFAYTESGDFMAQGKTFDELFSRFHARYPEGDFRILKNPDFTDAERALLVKAVKQTFGEERTA
jgi:hypothetical protein